MKVTTCLKSSHVSLSREHTLKLKFDYFLKAMSLPETRYLHKLVQLVIQFKISWFQTGWTWQKNNNVVKHKVGMENNNGRVK